MFCKKCGHDLPDESAFCNKCGQAQKEEAPVEKPEHPLKALANQQVPVPEEPLWKGRFSGKALGHMWLFWLLEIIALAIVYAAFLPPDIKEKGWLSYVFLVLVGVPFLWIVWTLLVAKLTVRYRLSTHRLFKETGFISRTVNEIELVRVDDVSVSQNLIQRIFNVGRVTVISTDATDPRTELVGIDNPIEVKEMIRNQVRKWRDKALHMESL